MTRAEYLRQQADRLWQEADKIESASPSLHEGDDDDRNTPTGRVEFKDFGGDRVFLNGYPDGTVMFGMFDGDPDGWVALSEKQAVSFGALLLNWHQFRKFGVGG